ncbi:MAG: hypothetical protein ACRESV_02295, partial [Nevskiales bacterium]
AGILVFGVYNSIVALTTHHAPNNFQVTVSTGLAAWLLTFYSVGFIISYYYDPNDISPLDRCTWQVYLAGMIFPAALTLGSRQGIVSPEIVWPTLIGMAAIIASFAIQRRRRAKRAMVRVDEPSKS